MARPDQVNPAITEIRIRITHSEIMEAETVISTTLIRIHRRQWNRLARKRHPPDFAPFQLPRGVGHKIYNAPCNHFCPSRERPQSTMSHSVGSARQAATKPQNGRPARLSMLRILSMKVELTSPLVQDPADGTSVSLSPDDHNQIRDEHQKTNIPWKLPVCNHHLNQDTHTELICCSSVCETTDIVKLYTKAKRTMTFAAYYHPPMP